MKVDYIAQKKFNYAEIKSYLSLSQKYQKFSNDGPVKKILESELESMLQIQNDRRVVCVSNGSTALHALFYLYEILKNRKLRWMTPSYTFPTPCVAGFDTVIVDIDPNTYTIPRSVSLDDVDGIVITSLFGTKTDVNYWQTRCKSEGKLCIFDNASSPMGTHEGAGIMNLGDASFGSLHHTKFLGVGEGGFVVVRQEHYDMINKICNFGFNDEREFDPRSSNFKMSEITAAYILSHVRHYDLSRHQHLQSIYVDKLRGKFEIFNYDENVIYGNLPVVFDVPTSKEKFREFGIEANKYYRPLRMTTNAADLFSRMINFPLHDQMTESQVLYVVEKMA